MKVWVVYEVETELPVVTADTLRETSAKTGYNYAFLCLCAKEKRVIGGKYTISRVDIGDEDDEEEDDGGRW